MHGQGHPAQPAVVPGTVYTDLLRNGKMEDPFWKDNEIRALPLMEQDYEYETCFDAEPELLASEKILLRFDWIRLQTFISIRPTSEMPAICTGSGSMMLRIF